MHPQSNDENTPFEARIADNATTVLQHSSDESCCTTVEKYLIPISERMLSLLNCGCVPNLQLLANEKFHSQQMKLACTLLIVCIDLLVVSMTSA